MAIDLGPRVVGSNVNTMNRFAYRTTGLFVKVLENLSRARVALHGTENIPGGNNIFVVNHFCIVFATCVGGFQLQPGSEIRLGSN